MRIFKVRGGKIEHSLVAEDAGSLTIIGPPTREQDALWIEADAAPDGSFRTTRHLIRVVLDREDLQRIVARAREKGLLSPATPTRVEQTKASEPVKIYGQPREPSREPPVQIVGDPRRPSPLLPKRPLPPHVKRENDQ